MNQQATMLRSKLAAQARGRLRTFPPPDGPAFPWVMHRFNPSRTDLATQCRDCWGWRDDPRHS